MITIHHRDLHKQIAVGVEQAKTLSRSILVSQCIKLDSGTIDPISFYAQARQYAGQRVFWSAPNGRYVMVGAGNAYTFATDRTNDYRKIEEEWQLILEGSIIDLEETVPGVGPVLLGAFSFDPLKEKTMLWDQFPTVKMVVPQHLLTVSKQETWLTANVIIHAHTNINELADRIIEEQNELLQLRDSTCQQPGKQTFTIEEIAKEDWLEAVKQVAGEIKYNQNIEKVVLAREIRLKSESPFDSERILKRLLNEQLTSYVFALESGGDCFIGATPERLVKKEGSQAFTTCLAGSIARGDTEVEDDILGDKLLNDGKNLLEHEVVVRAIREGFEQGCVRVEVPNHPILYKARDIQHLYTPIVGEVKQGVSLLTLVEKLHPTPALGGYPTKEALQKIREVEALDRGLYGGPIGWIDANGDGEFAVAIRSGLLQGKEASLFAGCGIVGDSDPLSEYKETQIKLTPMLSALGGSFNEIK